MILAAISRWHPMASMVIVAPLIVSRSSSFGMAVISFDLSATLTWPSTRLWPALQVGAAQRLTVDGDDAGGQPSQLADPGDEAALELLGVEGCKDVAELVV